MSFLSRLFGTSSKNNPANAAAPYLNQVPGMAKEQLNPWINQGQQAATESQGQYSKMASDPAAFHAALRASYTPSEGYKFREAQVRKALESTAAAGGFRGTEADRLGQSDLVNRMLGQDEGEYLDRVLGIQRTGLQGQEFGAQRGFGGAQDLTNILGNTLGAQAGLAYKGQENKNASRQALMRAIAQLFGGGGSVGQAITTAGGGQGASPYASSGNTYGGGSGASNQAIFGMMMKGLGG
jgi:hypothetical protein